MSPTLAFTLAAPLPRPHRAPALKGHLHRGGGVALEGATSAAKRRPAQGAPGAASMSTAPPEGLPAEGASADGGLYDAADWRSFRAHLLSTQRLHTPPHFHLRNPPSASPLSRRAAAAAAEDLWAHRVPAPEVGAVLVARDAHKWPPAFAHLRRAVVLLTQVSPARGVCGLLLTRGTRFTVRSHASVLARAGAEFGANAVMLGGDCSTGSLGILHPAAPDVCAGAEEIVPGVYQGGFNAARALVREGKMAANEFGFFVAYCKWTADALDAEMDTGAWDVVACAPGFVVGKERPTYERLWKQLHAFL